MARNAFDEWAEQEARRAAETRMSPIKNEGLLSLDECCRHLADINEFLRENDLTRGDLARGLKGVSESTLSTLFATPGELKPEARDRLVRKAVAWVELEYRARQAHDDAPLAPVETAVVKRAEAAFRRLTDRADIACLHGPAGIGKTTILRALHLTFPNTVLVTVRRDTRTMTGFCKALYSELRRRRRRSALKRGLDDIIELLRQSERVASRKVILVDQAHNLSDGALQVLCDLHDECGVSVLLMGTVDIHRRITDDDDIQYGQLSSRVGLRLSLTPELFATGRDSRRIRLFTVKDVRAVFERGKVRLHPAAADLLCQIANTSIGHLRRVDRLVQWGGAIARKRLGRGAHAAVMVIEEDIRKASRLVEGEDQARTLPVRGSVVSEAASG